MRILRTAAELQDADVPDAASRGLTLAEIEQVAAEVGIEPHHVRAAATLVATQAAERWTRTFGVPLRGSLVRALPGAVPDAAWPGILQVIRRAAGREGQHGHVPGALEWVHSDAGTEVRVEVTRAEHGTHVEVAADHRQAAALYLLTGPVLGACAAVVPIVGLGLQDVAEPWLLIGSGAVGGGVVAWAALRATCTRWQRRMRGMIGELSALATGVRTQVVARDASRDDVADG